MSDPTEKKIIEACRELLRDHSPEAISLRQVAKAADVSLGSITRRFGTKSDLFETCLEGSYLALRTLIENQIRSLSSAQDVHGALRDIIGVCVAFAFERRELAQLRLVTRVGARSLEPKNLLHRVEPYANLSAAFFSSKVGPDQARLTSLTLAMTALRYASHSLEDLYFITGITPGDRAEAELRSAIERHLFRMAKRLLAPNARPPTSSPL